MNSVMSAVILSAVMSASASADMFKPSKAEQMKLGKQAAAEIRKKEKVLPDSDPRVQLVKRVGRRILSTFSEKEQPWEYSFDVIESKEINAFALPGGPVFFSTGLLEKFKYEDELAAVMAHEITHVRREHWAYSQRDANKANILLLGLSVFGGRRDVLNATDLLATFYSLKYSRQHENQADSMGFDMLVAANYNPDGMVLLFETLKQTSKGGKPPEFLSSHPDDGNRIKNTKTKIEKSPKDFPALTKINL